MGSKVKIGQFFSAVLLGAGIGAGTACATEWGLVAPGAPKDLADQLRAVSTVGDTAEREETTPQDLLAAARADYARMVSVLYESGYYSGTVNIAVDGREAAEIPPLAAPSRIDNIAILVLPGPRFAFSTARIAPIVPSTELPEGFAPGEPARSGLISEAARAGIDGWREFGHAKADIRDQQITANHPRRTLSADVRLDPGPRLRFGDLIIMNRGAVRPERIRAIAGLPTGQTFSPDALAEAERRLRRTGAFSSVRLAESETISPGQRLDIEAGLVDAKPRRIGIGAELSSLEGFGLSAFWMHRNLLGGAERLRIEGAVEGIGGDTGGLDYHLSGRFDRPATFTPETGLYLETTLAEEDEPDYRERSLQVGGGLTHIFSDKLTGEAGLAYRYSEIDDDLGTRTLEHLLMPLSLTYDTRNDQLDATKGHYVDLNVTPFVGLNDDSGGTWVMGDARGYWGFGADDRFVFAARAQIGSVSGASLSELPPGMLFYSGGAGTVRGQPYQDLAIDLGGGRRIGGRSFMAFSGEIRAPLKGNFSAVAFYDIGFVGRDSWSTDDGDWHSGVGLGLRYATGIGPIRVDLATPVDGGKSGNVELYIGIGQAF
ncbi:autotransporter secretion outer membrane protein TamA [Roseovarius pacificus]|uniref:Autotransporter secretion outer membrane protein TamA n=1 Tax=Roseovarius pacificus TaxID=337701 RepID=A0A1M6WI37_9RHOB|nr:autotransporter assembly complex family protein [Roseovarius pacificus]GGO53298.1 outer membrane protein assembly factor [Roseovarius pacificus]SHK93410.1 autotransporter secretion outer membrane protein TamA [Roseovarius pacificus]